MKLESAKCVLFLLNKWKNWVYTKRFNVHRLVEHNLKDRIEKKEQLGQYDTNMIIMNNQVHISLSFLNTKEVGEMGA